MLRLAFALAALAALLLHAAPPRVGADPGTPTPAVISTEQATVVIAPQVVATEPPPAQDQPAAQPSSIPTVQERSAPAATNSVENSRPIAPTRTSYVGQGQASSPVPAYAPLPSPEELRQNALLRWGDRVPASVRRWAYIVVPAARKYHLDPNLVAAVMTMESDGDPLAWNSTSDARGLMQVLHGPWDPRANILEGTKMLAGFYDQFHNLVLALAAYNAGPNAVLSYGGVPPYRETRDYVIVVSYLYDLYSNHALTKHRRLQYRSTLKDLERFADQKKKIPTLARIGDVNDVSALECHHHGSMCQDSKLTSAIPSIDPFWPMGGSPDPLQRVAPLGYGA